MIWHPLFLAVFRVLGRRAALWFIEHRRNYTMLVAGSEWATSAIRWDGPRQERDQLILCRNILAWAGNGDRSPGFEDAAVAARTVLAG